MISPQVKWRLAGIIVFFVLWALYPGSSVVPRFTAVLASLESMAWSGQLWTDAAASLMRVFAGVTLALGLCVLVALVALVAPVLGDAFDGIAEMLRPIPPIAWTPVALFVFGVGDTPAIFIVAIGAFFPIWIGFQIGLQLVAHAHVQGARTLGAGPLAIAFLVILPSVLPHAVRGFRIGAGLGWFSLVAAEMVGASRGLGYSIQLFSLNLEIEKIYAYLLIIGGLGWLQSQLLRVAERKALAAWGIGDVTR